MVTPGPTVLTGVVQVNEHSIELPETEARALFRAVIATSRRGGPIVITPDIATWVNQASQISLIIAGGFTEEYDLVLTAKASSGRR